MLEGARNVYWKLTVRENLKFFAAVGGESPDALGDRHDDLLEQLSLREKADTPVNDLSRGQKQKVSLACALARDVDVTFLDGPTLGLDVESSVELRCEMRRLADQEDMTIVLSSHDMDVVEDVCDRVVIMNDGDIIADDAVADLIGVFRTFTYHVVVGGDPDGIESRDRDREPALDSADRDRLADAYGIEAFEPRGERTAFDVTLGEPERFYDLMDDLREVGVAVQEVESVDPDLEEVFLELTNGDGNRLDAAVIEVSAGTVDRGRVGRESGSGSYRTLLWAMAKKRALLMYRYPLNTLSGLAMTFLFFAMVFFGGRALSSRALTDSLGGIIVGYFLWSVALTSFSGLSWSVTRESQWGTLEQLYMSPFGYGRVMLAHITVRIVESFGWGAATLAFMLALTGESLHFPVETIVIITVLAIAPAIGLGFSSAAWRCCTSASRTSSTSSSSSSSDSSRRRHWTCSGSASSRSRRGVISSRCRCSRGCTSGSYPPANSRSWSGPRSDTSRSVTARSSG